MKKYLDSKLIGKWAWSIAVGVIMMYRSMMQGEGGWTGVRVRGGQGMTGCYWGRGWQMGNWSMIRMGVKNWGRGGVENWGGVV